jgi:hypothetical protein
VAWACPKTLRWIDAPLSFFSDDQLPLVNTAWGLTKRRAVLHLSRANCKPKRNLLNPNIWIVSYVLIWGNAEWIVQIHWLKPMISREKTLQFC